MNSLIGHSLFEELRNDHIAIHTGETPNKFIGSLDPSTAESVPVPSASIRVIDSKTKPRTFRKHLLTSNIVIVDLTNSNVEETDFIVKYLRQEDNPTPIKQTLILISSVMSWGNTPHKLVKHRPQNNEDSEMEDSKMKLYSDESEGDSHPNKVLYF